MDYLARLRNNYIVDVCEIRNIKYMIVAQDLVNKSILSLQLGIWLWLKGRGTVSMVQSEW